MFDFDATLPLMALQFLLLMVILNALFFKPLTKAIDDRESYIRTTRADAQERLAKAENLAKQYEQELAETRRQSQAVILAAEEDGKRTAAQQMSAAMQEAQAQREQAQQELDQQKQEAMQSLEQQVDALSREILHKILGAQLVG